jgi:hypothetical protein
MVIEGLVMVSCNSWVWWRMVMVMVGGDKGRAAGTT